MKRLIGQWLRALANKLDPQPKIVLKCSHEPDIAAIMDGIRRSARQGGINAVLR